MPSEEITNPSKQLQTMRQVAAQALSLYPLQVKSLRLLSQESNTNYTVQTENGEKYVLRIYSEMETTLQDNQAEMYWLKALTMETDLCVAEPIPDREGRYLNLVNTPDQPNMLRCAVFKWVPGRSLSHYLSPRNYYTFGSILARLHNHAETLKIPQVIQPRRWDTVFYFPDEPDLIHNPAYVHLFPEERIWLLDQVIERAEALLAGIYSSHNPPMLIHSDLHFWNVRIHHGSFYLMDFESVLLGYPVQDVAVTLYYGMERENYDDLSAAFQKGYHSQRYWPIESRYQLETLWAARTVNFVNYVARIEPDNLDYIERRCNDLWHYYDEFGG